jgi:hypothetical protein
VSTKVHVLQCTIPTSALFDSHSASLSATVQPTDERNWFRPKCSHEKQMAKEEAAGLAEQRKNAQTTCGNRTCGSRRRSADPALTTQVSALSTFAPCEKTAARVILRPLSAAPRAPTAALPAGSGRSPRTLGGVRRAMSPSGGGARTWSIAHGGRERG